MENKHKHLEFIQNAINRMAGNSFLLKGWTVTLVSAIFALAQKDANRAYLLVPIFPGLIFWFLDGYFLRQERLFRKLYDHVRLLDEDKIDFSMNTLPFQASVDDVIRVALSKTLVAFYGSVMAVVVVAALIQLSLVK
jgi:hypothetical protein